MFNKILEYLFRNYAREIKRKAQEDADLMFKIYKESLDIKDLIRGRFDGIRTGELSSIDNYLATLDDAGRLAFLSKAYDVINNNESFKMVVDFLLVESEKKAGLYSSDMVSVNFNRATCNGLTLLEDELLRLSSMYLAEKENNKPMTDEEKFKIIN